MISRQPGANIIATIDAINEQLPALRAFLPADANLAVVDGSLAQHPRHAARVAAYAAASPPVLVMLVVFVFLGSVRAALIPAVAIPVSLIGTLRAHVPVWVSLNNLSLMALIVAAGLVVDDAIVVLENISRHIEAGMPPFEAAMKGAGEVGFTLLVDEPVARGGVHFDPVHGRAGGAAVPGVFDHARRRRCVISLVVR